MLAIFVLTSVHTHLQSHLPTPPYLPLVFSPAVWKSRARNFHMFWYWKVLHYTYLHYHTLKCVVLYWPPGSFELKAFPETSFGITETKPCDFFFFFQILDMTSGKKISKNDLNNQYFSLQHGCWWVCLSFVVIRGRDQTNTCSFLPMGSYSVKGDETRVVFFPLWRGYITPWLCPEVLNMV